MTSRVVRTHPSNTDMLRAWDGDDGAYWAANAEIFDNSVARYHDRFFAAADVASHDNVLDIGCGTGQTTLTAARLAESGSALGVDLSSAMLKLARQRAAEQGIVNVEFLQADAQIEPFDSEAFDVAISRTGAMFFGDPAVAFSNIRRSIRPGGRLCLLVWREMSGNEWFLEFTHALLAGRPRPTPTSDTRGPFSLADRERTITILSDAGFSAITLHAADELMYFGVDADESFRFLQGQGFAKFMLRDLDEQMRAGALEALRETIVAHDTGNGVLYPSAAWVISARAE